MKLKDKSIVITGASSGIGKAMALKAAKDGATVYLAARKEDMLEAVKKEVDELGGTGVVVKTDVTKPEDIKNLFLKATEGGKVLDAVFNNAGLGYVAETWDLTDDEIHKMVSVNVEGMIMVSKYASEVMVRQGYGHIVMTSSVAGLITMPVWSVYVATKWAITGFTDSIRLELEPKGVKVSSLHPGLVKTGFFDKNKADLDLKEISQGQDTLEPKDVADAVYEALFTNQKKIIVPPMYKSYELLYKFMPKQIQKLIQKQAKDLEYHENIEEDNPEFSYVKPVSE